MMGAMMISTQAGTMDQHFEDLLESRMLGNLASPVRRGAAGNLHKPWEAFVVRHPDHGQGADRLPYVRRERRHG